MNRVALMLMALCLAAAAVSCQGKDKEKGSIATADVPDQEFSDFTTLESDSALVRWILKAPVARVYNARKLLVTDDPRIEFFDESGHPHVGSHVRQGRVQPGDARSHGARARRDHERGRLRARDGESRLGRKARRDPFGGFREIHERRRRSHGLRAPRRSRAPGRGDSSGTSRRICGTKTACCEEEIEKDGIPGVKRGE